MIIRFPTTDFTERTPALPKPGNCVSLSGLKVRIKTMPSFPSISDHSFYFTRQPPATETTLVFGTFRETGKIGKNTEEKDEFCNEIALLFAAEKKKLPSGAITKTI